MNMKHTLEKTYAMRRNLPLHNLNFSIYNGISHLQESHPTLNHSGWMQDVANQSIEKRLDLELVGLYGAEARRFGANAANNPYVGKPPRIAVVSQSETWLHACAWRQGWNNAALLPQDF